MTARRSCGRRLRPRTDSSVHGQARTPGLALRTGRGFCADDAKKPPRRERPKRAASYCMGRTKGRTLPADAKRRLNPETSRPDGTRRCNPMQLATHIGPLSYAGMTQIRFKGTKASLPYLSPCGRPQWNSWFNCTTAADRVSIRPRTQQLQVPTNKVPASASLGNALPPLAARVAANAAPAPRHLLPCAPLSATSCATARSRARPGLLPGLRSQGPASADPGRCPTRQPKRLRLPRARARRRRRRPPRQ